MSGDLSLSRLNGVISCVMAVLVCVAVGALGLQYGPSAFSSVREATTFKPAASPTFQFEPVELKFDTEAWRQFQPITVDSVTGNGANRSNDRERSMREFRP